MSDPDWYSTWRHEAVHELMSKNDRVSAEFRLRDFARWDYQLEDCSLTFSNPDGARVIADILLIGSTSTELGNWQWAWANDYWPRQVVAGVDVVRAFGNEHGIDELTQGWVDDEKDLNGRGWELAAVAARVMTGLGVYRPQTDNGAIYFLYRGFRRLN